VLDALRVHSDGIHDLKAPIHVIARVVTAGLAIRARDVSQIAFNASRHLS
jgi:hypothetical protein